MLNKIYTSYSKAILAVAFTFIITGLSTAAMAQGLSLKSIGGGNVDVQGQGGKVVVLAIGASWLPLSKDQIVIANKLARKYAGKEVVIYWVSNDSDNAKSKNFASDEQVKAFADKSRWAGAVLRDPSGMTLRRFGADQIPSFVILDKSGKQAGEPFGGIDPETDITPNISAKIDSLLR